MTLKKRSLLVIAILFANAQIQANVPNTPNVPHVELTPQKSFKERIATQIDDLKKQVLNFIDLNIRTRFGDKNVSPEMEEYVRNILTKVGVSNPEKVKIKKLSKIAMCQGEKNAFAFDFGQLDYMFLNEEWLNSIDEDAKDFIITHEAAHLKCKHASNRLKFKAGAASSIAAIIILDYILSKRLYQETTLEDGTSGTFISDKNFKILIACKMAFCALLGTVKPILQKINQDQEYEADLIAFGKIPFHGKGGEKALSLLKGYNDELCQDVPAECYEALRHSLNNDDSFTHPSLENRLNRLKAYHNNVSLKLLALVSSMGNCFEETQSE